MHGALSGVLPSLIQMKQYEDDMRMTEEEKAALNIIGARLRMVRTLHNMTQAQVGEKLGLSGQQICKYEYGQDHVSLLLAYRYAKLFKKPMQILFSCDNTI